MPEDMENVLKRFEQQHGAAAAEERQAMYRLLQEKPEIVRIEVEYDGYGDSGTVEQVRCFAADGTLIESDEAMQNAIEAYVVEVLPGGWELDDGSFGTVKIDVPARKAAFDHTFRFNSTEHAPFED